MGATAADAIRALRRAKIITVTDGAVQSAYPTARDGLATPEPGYFVDAADAATVLAAKQNLIGDRRRWFKVIVPEIVEVDPTSAIPCWQLVCAELDADLPVMLTRIEVDYETEVTTMEVVG